MKKPTSVIRTVQKENGGHRNICLNSYLVVLCKKGGSEVKAIRADEYQNKTDVMHDIWGNFPEWNIKTVHRLYDQDFDE